MLVNGFFTYDTVMVFHIRFWRGAYFSTMTYQFVSNLDWSKLTSWSEECISTTYVQPVDIFVP